MERASNTFLENVLNNVKNFPEKVAILCPGRQEVFTFYEFGSGIFSFQSLLKFKTSGEKVILYMENRPEWLFALFGTLLKGGIVVPVDSFLSPEELANILKDCKPSWAVVSHSTADRFNSAMELAKVPVSVIELSRFVLSDGFPEYKPRNPEEPAFLLYTSGTTGTPKGVVLTIANIDHNIKAVERLGFLNENDRFLALLPFHHTYPLMAVAILPVALGMSVVFLERLTPDEIFSVISKSNVTVLVGVPRLYQLLRRKILQELSRLPLPVRVFATLSFKVLRNLDLKPLKRLVFAGVQRQVGKSLRFMISGGAKLNEDVWKDLEAFGFEVLEGYGLTETSPLVCVNVPGCKKVGSAGKPVPGVEVKIAEDGEVLVKGPNVMAGYYTRGSIKRSSVKNGWLHTGDLGYIDEDGFLHITGRKKEVIVLEDGRNLHPEDVEMELVKSPYILDAGIFYHEGRLKAIVVPDMEALRERGLDSAETFIKEEFKKITGKLQPYKRPKDFKILYRELPRTRIGKLRRFLLPRIWEELNA